METYIKETILEQIYGYLRMNVVRGMRVIFLRLKSLRKLLNVSVY